MHIDIKTALIGAIGGLVGGVLIAVMSYYLGLLTSRQELLQTQRAEAYVQWCENRTLSRLADKLEDEGKAQEAKKAMQKFHREGRGIMCKIATYSGKKVVESVASWYRTHIDLNSCTYVDLKDKKRLIAEIQVHQAIRKELLPKEDEISDADMAVLLLQCDLPPILCETFSVSGEIHNDKDEPLKDCTVELLITEGTTVWQSYEVGSNFSLSFSVVEPFEDNYLLLIECPGYKNYKTIIDYGSSVTPQKPLALNTIRMKRK